jgi:hypothetical protein
MKYTEQRTSIAAKEKQQVTYNSKLIRLTDFLVQILNARRARNDVFPILKENNCQCRLVYLAKFDGWRSKKVFYNKEKQRIQDHKTSTVENPFISHSFTL